jgi:hypothetical protein
MQHAFNAAVHWIARVCWDAGLTTTHRAHPRVYGEARLAVSLGAHLAVCARAQAVEAIKAVKATKRETCPRFRPPGSIRYAARTSRLLRLDRVARNTLDGRVVCRMLSGGRQRAMLVDPAWAIGGPICSGGRGSPIGTAPRAGKRRTNTHQTVACWASSRASSRASCSSPPTARGRSTSGP